MKANERAKERGCVLPLSLAGKIKGVTRQTLNNIFNSDLKKFDEMIDDVVKRWESICKR
jgi:hypothetical protein